MTGPTIQDALQTIEQAVATATQTELAQLLGTLETIKVKAWTRAMQAPQNGQGSDDLLTVPQVAAKLKLSPYRVYELVRQHTLKSVRLGKSVRVRPADLADYLQQGG